MFHTKHVRLTENELTETALSGATIFGLGDERIGYVSGLGRAQQVVVEVGGYLGCGAKAVGLPLQDCRFVRDQSNAVQAVTSWGREDLRKLPDLHASDPRA